MSQYLMIKKVKTDDVVFEFSRNSELYQFLTDDYEIDFPYDKWEKVNPELLELALSQLDRLISEQKENYMFTILKSNDVYEVKEIWETIKNYSNMFGQLSLVIKTVYWNDFEWCVA